MKKCYAPIAKSLLIPRIFSCGINREVDGTGEICATVTHKFETPPGVLVSRLSHISEIMAIDNPFECIKGT